MMTLRKWSDKLVFIDYSYRGPFDSDRPIEQLRHALLTSDRTRATSLLDAGVDLHATDDEGAEPIHDAALGGDKDLVAELLARGSDPNQTSNTGRTPICEASYAGRVEAARILLNAGAHPDPIPKSGYRPILEAGIRGSAPVMKLLIEAGAPAEIADRFGSFTPLSLAIKTGDAALVAMLLERGADREEEAQAKRPLMIAADHGFIDVLAVLLSAGADIHAADSYGGTALWWANKRKPELVRFLLEHGARADIVGAHGRTPLTDAASYGATESFELLLAAGAPIEPLGMGALSEAVSGGHVALAQRILDLTSVDVNHPDPQSGRTPLIAAAHGGYAEAVALLIERGAEIGIRDSTKRTAVHVAAAYAHRDALQAFLVAGTEISSGDELGMTPLILACSNRVAWLSEDRRLPTVDFLLAQRVMVDHADHSKWTALHHVAADGFDRILQRLLDAGADPGRIDKFGRTPLAVAMEQPIPDPANERRMIRPMTATDDLQFRTVEILLDRARRDGLPGPVRSALLEKAKQFRCPEIVRALEL